MPLVGCTPDNAPLIEKTFRRVLGVMGKLQECSTFLFGERPTLADFGWYGQLESLATDPTSQELIRATAPAIFSYLQILEDASGVDAAWPSEVDRLPPAVVQYIDLGSGGLLDSLDDVAGTRRW